MCSETRPNAKPETVSYNSVRGKPKFENKIYYCFNSRIEMIQKITIDNFRSIKHLELEALNLCAIVGANSSGKSNVLKAIDLVLGEGWTTKAKVAKELFNDTTKPIKILIELNDPISWTSAYSGEKAIKFVSLKMELTPLNCEIRLWEKFPSKQEKPSYLNEEFKKSCHFIYIPSLRDLKDEMRVSNWTLLGKMMKLVQENYIDYYDGEENLKSEFTSIMKPAKDFLEYDFSGSSNMVSFKKFYDVFVSYCKQNSAGIANNFKPQLDIYNLNWFYKTLQITVSEDFHEKIFDAEEVGSGMQNLILLSIFQSYAELSLGKAIFAIEEPELFLYPQAQRELYDNFQKLSETTQIFYTTHNPNFLNPQRAFEIELITKTKEAGTTLRKKNKDFINEDYFKTKEFKIYAHFNTYRNEIFFAKYVILVEGDSDKILWTTLIEEKWNIPLNKNGISIIECGGKGGVMYFIGVMRLMGITDYFAIWDRDSGSDPDAQGQLKSTKDSNSGMELVPTLEKFLKKHFPEQQFRDDYKIEDAYKFANEVEVEKIPNEFIVLKDRLISLTTPIEESITLEAIAIKEETTGEDEI